MTEENQDTAQPKVTPSLQLPLKRHEGPVLSGQLIPIDPAVNPSRAVGGPGSLMPTFDNLDNQSTHEQRVAEPMNAGVFVGEAAVNNNVQIVPVTPSTANVPAQTEK